MKIKGGNVWSKIIFLNVLIFTYLTCVVKIAWAASLFGTRISLEIGTAAIGFSLDTGNRPLRWEGIKFSKSHLVDGFFSLPDFWIVDGFRGKEFNLILPVWILIVFFLIAAAVIRVRLARASFLESVPT